MLLKVTSIPGKDLINENVLIHNSISLSKHTHVGFRDTVYKIKQMSTVQSDQIAMNTILRVQYKLAYDDIVELTPMRIDLKEIEELVVVEVNIKRTNNSAMDLVLQQDTLVYHVQRTLKNNYVHSGQIYIFDVDGRKYRMTILPPVAGKLGPNTKIFEFVDDKGLYIIKDNSKLCADLAKKIFSNNFKFKTIGIGGLTTELETIFKEAFSSRSIPPKIAKKLGVKHVRGMLLHGPPGCGKTNIAREIGKVLSVRQPKVINAGELLNKFVGESEANMRSVFAEAINDFNVNGEDSELHIIIFDEIDAICKQRSGGGNDAGGRAEGGVLTQLLTILDGVNLQLPNIFVIGLTNRKDILDPALLRPGRLEILVEIGLPNKEGRKEIFEIYLNKIDSGMITKDIDIDKLAELTENYTGAEIESVVKKASSYAVHGVLTSDTPEKYDNIVITPEHLLRGIRQTVPALGRSLNSCGDMEVSEDTKHIKAKYKEFAIQYIVPSRVEYKTYSVLVYGISQSGKSSLLSVLPFLFTDCIYTKIIKAVDVVEMDDFARIGYIMKIVKDAYLSENSLVMIDDVDVVINFSSFSGSVVYSNRLLQCILTIVKTQRPGFNVVMSCSNIMLYEELGKSFEKMVELYPV